MAEKRDFTFVLVALVRSSRFLSNELSSEQSRRNTGASIGTSDDHSASFPTELHFPTQFARSAGRRDGIDRRGRYWYVKDFSGVQGAFGAALDGASFGNRGDSMGTLVRE